MSDKNSLLASLTGEAGNDESDLFGALTVNEDLLPNLTSGHSNVGASLPPEVSEKSNGTPLVAPKATTSGPPESLLSKSGLLGVSSDMSGGDGGGLFDDVDAEDQKKAEQEKRLLEEEEEQNRREIEDQRRQQQDAEIRRQQEDQQQQSMIFQQQQQQRGQQYYNGVNQGHFGQQHQQPVQTYQQQSVSSPEQLTGNIEGLDLKDNFYREHGAPSIIPNGAGYMQNAHNNGTSIPQNSYYYGTQQHQQQAIQGGLPAMIQPQPSILPSTTAGMHNMPSMNLGQVRKIALVKPQYVPPLYADIRVTEPMLIQTQSFLISSPPYWSYQITSQLAGNQGTWFVRRRFRHVVALEDRLRLACPGSILPPRPEKHTTRALEEASTQQSAEFAVQRAKELEQYLKQLAKHPAAGQSQVLRLFLGLQDDIGTAWAECSTNALTRLGAVGAGVTLKVAETTNLTAASAPAHEWEEDAELLALCSSENLRLGAVSQAVPKLEGTVMLLREQGDMAGALGMELSKASKTVDMDFKMCEILSNGLLRHGRRTKRLALEMSAAMESFLYQYKLVRYEKMAMHDRRQAIQKKAKERGRADSRAIYLSQQQRHLQINGHMGQLNRLEQNAIYMDSQALDAVGEADEIGARLKSEIHRVAITRRTEWNTSMKTVASIMKEACSERVAIWQSTLEAFENLYKHENQSQAMQDPSSSQH
ncbi:PX domain containing protein [Nitzschia inconspicua]|uniref:PX domain containing protein n=1 Tax=Nitzschia inconspicua TaxID=303405 RepID=A0A9K3KGF1_9STRA|nr:PX domain containing protein [Nitzschia inconspicua]